MTTISEPIKHAIDAAAAITVLGVLAEIIPVIAAAFAIVWYAMQMKDRHKRNKEEQNANKRFD